LTTKRLDFRPARGAIRLYCHIERLLLNNTLLRGYLQSCQGISMGGISKVFLGMSRAQVMGVVVGMIGKLHG